MAGENVKHLTDAEFDEYVLKGDLPSLVDFWAPWCGPCKMVAPILNDVAEEMDGKVKIGKLNVDHNQTIAGKYKVRNIPTLLLFKDGQEINRFVGLKTKKFLIKELSAQA
ncbi:MAG: thioredoxin [Cyclobacteriaceae bacterium]|nr:thioredoxin [Cyclobacteriaceae bacterium]